MNSWNFTGNIGKDCESRYLPTGDAVVSFSVAVKAGYGDKASTTWARCSMFGKRGESVAPYLVKGQLVGIVGEMSAREWKDKEGNTRTSIEVRVGDLTLLGRKDAADEPQQAPQAPKQEASHGPASSQYDDDIPFDRLARGLSGYAV